MLAPQLPAITDDIHDAPIVYLDLMFNTALAAEFQQRPPPINESKVTLAQRCQPKAMVIARIGKIADTHAGAVKQTYYRGDDLFPRQPPLPQVPLQALPELGQRFSKFRHSTKFDAIAGLAPVSVVAVLLTLARVQPGCL